MEVTQQCSQPAIKAIIVISEQEKAAIDKLTEVWNALAALPTVHADHMNDIRFHIHALQSIVLSRGPIQYFTHEP